MLNLLSLIFNRNKKNVNNKVICNLFYKEQFKFLKTTHSYHLVDPSPWRAAVKCTLFYNSKDLVRI
jgi:CTP:phosphocholine cytidylyltransferase-like protein